MASAVVYHETKLILQEHFAPAYPVLDFDSIDETLVDGIGPRQPFIALEEITQIENHVGFGDPQSLCQREEGVIVAHFFTPAPESSATARGLAQQIQDFMRHRVYSGIRISSASPPDLEMMNNGLWTSAAVALSYQYDFHVAAP